MLVRLPMSNVNLLHIFVQSMLLMYIGYTGSHSSDYAYLALMAITLCIPFLVPAPESADAIILPDCWHTVMCHE